MDEGRSAKLFELADLILAVGRHIEAAKEAEAEGGTPLEGAVMRFVDRHPGTTARTAAEATQLISSNFSRAVRGLESKGLLRREVDPHDARRVRLYSTDKAHRNLQRLRHIWSRLLDDAVTEIDEVDPVIATLRHIETRLVTRAGR
ncbi:MULTISPECIES: MarR family winged helix-turn-helix transcriptional regulator [unclassified Amycolatopsis]|uniref:MarR family winged helix-turn-helix transcriptional regulator n=1 Tax=unclassified Amycolatopsis TaxID=2618356 RepID=UPI002875AB35|nr:MULTISPECIES: MarR family winged helix-turn-helix transcriptional regulator [unclassified Amycolatopsis]MDS0135859.1 winged helix-turn-helix transcriptional regulator [Amycolatopsis sp. 505]MDS0145552.1 winged helix-turn-helix transcriptional regulator [Amycolatopsis sp. CM201R]